MPFDPQKFAEYKTEKTGINPIISKPSIDKSFSAYKATVSKPVMADSITPESTMKEKIHTAAGYLPLAGSIVGGGLSALAAPGTAGASLLGGSALAGLGAAAGKAGEQLVNRAIGYEAPTTTTQAAKEIGIEGGLTGALNMIGGTLIPKVAKSIRPVMTQAMKAFEGLDEKLGMKVLKEPEILLRAKPIEYMKQKFGEFFEKIGFKYGPAAVEEVTGAIKLTEKQSIKLVNRVADRVKQVEGFEKLPENQAFIKEVTQEALAGRTELDKAITDEFKAGHNAQGKYLLEKLDIIDDWLEKRLPGFEALRNDYSEALIAEKFKPFLPQNKNGTTSVLRTLAGFGTAIFKNPVAGAAAITASSPYVAGKAIQAAAIVGPKTGAALANLTAQEIKAKYKSGELDKQTAADMLRTHHGFK